MASQYSVVIKGGAVPWLPNPAEVDGVDCETVVNSTYTADSTLSGLQVGDPALMILSGSQTWEGEVVSSLNVSLSPGSYTAALYCTVFQGASSDQVNIASPWLDVMASPAS
jgi:hypothetical protein